MYYRSKIYAFIQKRIIQIQHSGQYYLNAFSYLAKIMTNTQSAEYKFITMCRVEQWKIQHTGQDMCGNIY